MMHSNVLVRNAFLVVLLTALTAIVLTVAVRWSLTIELIMGVLLILGLLIALAAEERSMTVGLVAIVLTFALGYRTIYLTPVLRLHPGELLVWGVFVIAIVQLILRRETISSQIHIPVWLWLFSLFWVWGWFAGVSRERPADVMLGELKNVAMLFPLFVITSISIANTRKAWYWISLALFATGTLIAMLGLIEYSFPQVHYLLPGFFANPNASIQLDGFRRATFSFWGAPAATFVLILTLPFASLLWSTSSQVRWRTAIVACTAAQLAAIYIGGYRSVWSIVLIQLTVLFWFEMRILWSVLLVGPIVTALVLVPTGAFDRFGTLVAAVQGAPVDSSSASRIALARSAYNSVIAKPRGIGWAGIGWAHSDILQIAANLGLLAGVLFVGVIVWQILQLFRFLMRNSYGIREGDRLPLTILLSVIAASGLLAVQGVLVLPQLSLPVFLILALAAGYLEQSTKDLTANEEPTA